MRSDNIKLERCDVPEGADSAVGSMQFVALPMRDLPESVLNIPDIDPYLVWADVSAFMDYDLLQDMDSTPRLMVTVELQPDCHFLHWLELLSSEDITGSFWTGERQAFVTARITWSTCQRLLAPSARAVVARLEMGLPWKEQRPEPRPAVPLTSYESLSGLRPHGALPPWETLPCLESPSLGILYGQRPREAPRPDVWIVMDDGCPFARSDLRLGNGETRLRSLWYQDEVTLEQTKHLGSWKTSQGYGRRWGHAELNTLLRHWGRDAATCYARFGDPRLARRSSHGAHVLSLLLNPSDRTPERIPMGVDDQPPRLPTPAQVTEPDVVFVQLPRRVASTVSRGAITPLLLDGLGHGLRDTEPGVRATAVISMEAYDGPHDGSSLLEKGIQAWVEVAKTNHIDLQVIVAAGNAHQRAVVQPLDLEPGRRTECVWRVPPNSERPAWMEMWFPGDQPLPDIRVVAPGQAPGKALSAGSVWAWPSSESPVLVAVMPAVPAQGGWCVVLRLAPTCVFRSGQAAAPCGDWRVLLDSDVEMRGHAYLARCWQAPRERQRGRQGRLFLAGSVSAPEASLQRPAQPLSAGSLNGLACGGAEMTVVGGSQVWPPERSPEPMGYSGRGPARDEWRSRSRSQQVLAPSEESPNLPGLRAQGHLEACTTRMGGTSMAVPLHAKTLKGGGRRGTLPP